MQNLNPEQKKAVETTEGRVLILAGAGSGKTSVLTHRMCHLIRDKQVNPNAILGLTFTNKAASEMRERVAQMLDRKTAKQLTLSTFHSFCCRILRKEISYLGYTPEFSLYDEQDVKRLTKGIARHLLEHEGELPSLEQTMEKISFAKSRGAIPEEKATGTIFSQKIFLQDSKLVCALTMRSILIVFFLFPSNYLKNFLPFLRFTKNGIATS